MAAGIKEKTRARAASRHAASLTPARILPSSAGADPARSGGAAAPMNHNVRACLALCVLSGIADSTWSGTVLAAFILISSGSNATVGLVEAAQGLATLLFALPIGYLADTYSRSNVIAMGGVLCLAAAAATTYVILDVERSSSLSTHATAALFGLMALWGVVGGIISGPAQALYADSIPAGERSKWYVYLFGAYMVSSAVGPLIAVLSFQTLTQDTWTLPELRVVIVFGMACEAACALVMFTFRDSAALDEGAPAADAAAPAGAAPAGAAPADADGADGADGAEPDGATPADGDAEIVPAPADAPGAEHAAPASPRASAPPPRSAAPPPARAPPRACPPRCGVGCGVSVGAIPYVLFSSSLLTALGAGMTVKFFPLFFKVDCRLSPTQVQCIYIAVPFAMVLCSGLMQRLSTLVGRVQTIVLARASGVALLFTMAALQLRTRASGLALVMIPIYILRTALINSVYPLEESILMDYVPRQRRARWKSLESVAQFGWCGSAAVGGYLGDRYSYSFTFVITATIQGVATLLVATLMPVVPRREADASLHARGGGADGAAAEEGGSGGGWGGARKRRGADRRAGALSRELHEPLLDPVADSGGAHAGAGASASDDGAGGEAEAEPEAGAAAAAGRASRERLHEGYIAPPLRPAQGAAAGGEAADAAAGREGAAGSAAAVLAPQADGGGTPAAPHPAPRRRGSTPVPLVTAPDGS